MKFSQAFEPEKTNKNSRENFLAQASNPRKQIKIRSGDSSSSLQPRVKKQENQYNEIFSGLRIFEPAKQIKIRIDDV